MPNLVNAVDVRVPDAENEKKWSDHKGGGQGVSRKTPELNPPVMRKSREIKRESLLRGATITDVQNAPNSSTSLLSIVCHK